MLARYSCRAALRQASRGVFCVAGAPVTHRAPLALSCARALTLQRGLWHGLPQLRSCSSVERPKADPIDDEAKLEEPSKAELKQLFIVAAIPMVGFGIMDNFIMIQAGDLIDNTLGVRFGLATLTAAACGQIISDTCGVGFGGAVDAGVSKLGLRKPSLTLQQMQLRSARLVTTFGGVVGVMIGCCLGMTCLLFKDLDAADREKRAAELSTLFTTLLGHPEEFGAERCSLFLWDEARHELWSKVATGVKGIIAIPDSAGLAGLALQEKKLINVPDAYDHPSFNKSYDLQSGFRTRQVMAIPVVHPDGTIYGVLQLINKLPEEGQGATAGPFTDGDERLARLMSRHAAVFLSNVGDENILTVPSSGP